MQKNGKYIEIASGFKGKSRSILDVLHRISKLLLSTKSVSEKFWINEQSYASFTSREYMYI